MVTNNFCFFCVRSVNGKRKTHTFNCNLAEFSEDINSSGDLSGKFCLNDE